MTMKMLLAGVLGAVAMFVWTSIAHLALPLGEAGVAEIPNEQAVLAAMQSNMGEKAGLYIFPGPGLGPNASSEEKHKAMEQLEKDYGTKPSGILMYKPPGQAFNFPKFLTIEFLTELAECLLAVFLLMQTRLAAFGARVVFVTVLGLLAAVATNISYWNWYGFPTTYTASYMCIQIVGFLCAGLVIALVLKKSPAHSATA